MNGSPTEFSHTSHSALTLDYAWITNRIQPHFTFSTYTGLCMDHQQNSATLHIQHLHWIMNVSPTEFSHTSHSALTLDYECITNRIQPHFTFSTYTGLCMYHQQNSATLHIQHLHWIMNVSPTAFGHTSHSALTHWIMNVSPTEFSHTSHSALILDYAWITKNSATFHIQHLHWIMHGSPTEFSHTSHSALIHTGLCIHHQKFSHISHSALDTGLCMYHQQFSHTSYSAVTHWIMNVSSTIQPHFKFSTNTHWIMNTSPTEFSHTSHSALTQWIMNVSPTEFSHTSHSALMHSTLWMYHPQTSATLHIICINFLWLLSVC